MIAAINHQRALRIKFHDVLISYWKNWPFWRDYFGSKRHALEAVAVVEAAVVEKLKQE